MTPDTRTQVYNVKRGDDGYKFTDHLSKGGVSVDLSRSTVGIVIRDGVGEIVVQSQARILQTGTDQDQSLPNVEWLPAADDLDLPPGLYEFEWHVVLRGQKKITLPAGEYGVIRIVARLNNFLYE